MDLAYQARQGVVEVLVGLLGPVQVLGWSTVYCLKPVTAYQAQEQGSQAQEQGSQAQDQGLQAQKQNLVVIQQAQ